MQELGKRSYICLSGIVLLTLILRLLELRTGSITTFYSLTPHVLARPWLLLMPVDVGTGAERWSTTGLVFVSLLNSAIGPKIAFCSLSIFLVSAAFLTSWLAFRSLI